MKKYALKSIFKLSLVITFSIIFLSCNNDETNNISVNDLKITQEQMNNTLNAKFKFESYTYPMHIDAGASGENVSWDFSSISGTPSEFTSIIENCPDSPNCNYFSNSDKISFFEGENSYSYFSLSNDELLEIGSYSNEDGKNIYTDKKISYKFPIIYGQMFEDSFSSGYEFSTDGDIVGNQTVSVDGFGTLKTPVGTYTVLRIKRVQNITNPSTPDLIVNVINYEWIDSEGIVRFAILNSTTSYLSNTNITGTLYYLTDIE